MIAMIGTSDRPCWLAEACKILLLLLHNPGRRCDWSAVNIPWVHKLTKWLLSARVHQIQTLQNA